MSVPANVHRSELREAQVLFRCTAEDRDLLKRQAHSQGLSMQAYMEMKIFDREVVERFAGRPHQDQRELPLTG